MIPNTRTFTSKQHLVLFAAVTTASVSMKAIGTPFFVALPISTAIGVALSYKFMKDNRVPIDLNNPMASPPEQSKEA